MLAGTAGTGAAARRRADPTGRQRRPHGPPDRGSAAPGGSTMAEKCGRAVSGRSRRRRPARTPPGAAPGGAASRTARTRSGVAARPRGAAVTKAGRPARRSRSRWAPVRDLPVLSCLLLVTGLGLLLLLAMRASRTDRAGRQRAGRAGIAALASATDVRGRRRPQPTSSPRRVQPSPTRRRCHGAQRRRGRRPRSRCLEALAAELHRHQAALEERERAIVLRETVVTTVEERVRAQIGQLEG